MERNDLLGIPKKTDGVINQLQLYVCAGYGSTGTCVMKWTTPPIIQGDAITYIRDAVNGDSFRVNYDGTYHIFFESDFITGGSAIGLTVNEAAGLTATNFNTITVAQGRLCGGIQNAGNGYISLISIPVPLTAGDVIRVHGDGAALDSGAKNEIFRILKLA